MLGVLLILACDRPLLRIEVTERADTVVEGASLLEQLAGDLGFDEFTTFDLSAAQELRNQGVEPGDIQDVQLLAFELEVLDPEGQDLTFLDSMAVYVAAPDLPQVRIASQAPFPVGEPAVSFSLDAVDLTEYATASSMTFTTEVTGRRPDQDTAVQARIQVDVGVTTQGARNQVR